MKKVVLMHCKSVNTQEKSLSAIYPNLLLILLIGIVLSNSYDEWIKMRFEEGPFVFLTHVFEFTYCVSVIMCVYVYI